MPAALLVASTRCHADARETLRLQDAAGVLIEAGWSVDILVPRRSAILTATLNPEVRTVDVPHVPFSQEPPRRPSFRRMLAAFLMFLRGTALVSRRPYAVVHGFNDGAAIARAIDRVTVRRFPYIADYTDPFGVRGLHRGMFAAIVRSLENSAMRHAAALVFADQDVPGVLEKRPPASRLSVIPDAHAEISPDSFTRAEFAEAILKIYDYVTRDRDLRARSGESH